jgi:hypothetical protein
MHRKLLLLGALLWCQNAIAADIPAIRVFSSSGSPQKAGQSFGVGQLIYTGKGGIVTGDLKWGGIKYFSILPNSSMKLTEYGLRQSGGHATRLDITGEVIIAGSVVNPNSQIRVCFLNFWGNEGCTILRSAVRYEATQGLVAVSEGKVKLDPGTYSLTPGQYSLLGKDGQFTAPRSISEGGAVLQQVGRSRTIGKWKALPGWRFKNGSVIWQGPILGPLLSPLEPSSP